MFKNTFFHIPLTFIQEHHFSNETIADFIALVKILPKYKKLEQCGIKSLNLIGTKI